jgi:TatD DNase family protein
MELIIDTHTHYDDEQFDNDRKELLCGLKERGIGTVIHASASMSNLKAGLALAKEYDFIYTMAGFHPDEIAELSNGGYEYLESLVASPEIIKENKIGAIGEIGLDYHWMVRPKEEQIEGFRKQMRLAKKAGLPVNIHSRDAAEDTWNVMKEEHLEEIGGIIHCFSGSVEMSKNYLAAGFYLGIGGVVTFKNSKKLKQVVIEAPVERLVLETDCPYLAPEPNRGKRNDSGNLIYVAAEIASLKDMPIDDVIRITSENARRVYGL